MELISGAQIPYMNLSTDLCPGMITGVSVIVVTIFLIFFRLLEYNPFKKSTPNVLDGLPGPKGIWLIGNVHQLWNPKNRSKVLTDWCSEYKGCFTFGIMTFRVVVLTSPEYIHKLLMSGDEAYIQKPYFVSKPLIGAMKDGLFLSSGIKWKTRRKLLSRAFTFQSLVGYLDVFNNEGRNLVNQLDLLFSSSDQNQEEDNHVTSLKTRGRPVENLLWRAALRSICGSVLGSSVLKSERDGMLLAESTKIAKAAVMSRMLKPWLLNDWIFSLHPISRLVRIAGAHLEKFTTKIIKAHAQGGSAKRSSLPVGGGRKRFTSMIEEMLDAGIDASGIQEECQHMIIAGYETVATSLQFLFFLLALHPEHQETCRKEVDEVFEDNNNDDDLTFDTLSRLKHLDRCVLETLRFYSVAFSSSRKILAPLKLDDHLILPANTNIGILIQGVHQNPDIYPDPGAFKPERFLPEEVAQRHPAAFIPFSAGPRNCIGYKFGLIEIRIIAAYVLRHFTIETTDGLEDVPLLSEFITMPERPYNFTFTRRVHT